MIYTHSHIDHFGGEKGIVDEADVDAGRISVIAPGGFMEEAAAENVFVGTAMGRRSDFMFGAALPKDPDGQIGCGLGRTTSTGEPTLIPPTIDITITGEGLTIAPLAHVGPGTGGRVPVDAARHVRLPPRPETAAGESRLRRRRDRRDVGDATGAGRAMAHARLLRLGEPQRQGGLQQYLGWQDGNPAHLWPHPPVAAAERYVAAMGGTDAAVALARTTFDEGDLRLTVEVLNNVLFSDGHHEAAQALQADAFEQIAFGVGNGTWRNVSWSAPRSNRR